MEYTAEVINGLIDKRRQVCKSCEFLFTPLGLCKKCGCVIKIKTMMHRAKCPVGKWGQIDSCYPK